MMQLHERSKSEHDDGGNSELDTIVVLPYSINIVPPEDADAPVEDSKLKEGQELQLEDIPEIPEKDLEVVKKIPGDEKSSKEPVDEIPLNFMQKWGWTILVSCIGK